jgi:hypothetical protein
MKGTGKRVNKLPTNVARAWEREQEAGAWECQTRCKIYETCMFVILPIYEMPSKFHIIHHSMNLTYYINE